MQIQYNKVIEDLTASHEILRYFYSRWSVLKDNTEPGYYFHTKGKINTKTNQIKSIFYLWKPFFKVLRIDNGLKF